MRFVDHYGSRASLRWIVLGWLLVVRDGRGYQRLMRTFLRRSRAVEMMQSYGYRWHRVGLFGRVDEDVYE